VTGKELSTSAITSDLASKSRTLIGKHASERATSSGSCIITAR